METQNDTINLPENISLAEYDDYIQITRKWLSKKALRVPSILLIAIVVLVAKGSGDSGLWVAAIAAIPTIYFTLAVFVNRTDIFISKNRLALKHKPVPWPGNKQGSAQDIKQIHIRDVVNRGRETVTYLVLAETRSGEIIKLVSGLHSKEQALFIEKTVEKYLGLVDAPYASTSGDEDLLSQVGIDEQGGHKKGQAVFGLVCSSVIFVLGLVLVYKNFDDGEFGLLVYGAETRGEVIKYKKRTVKRDGKRVDIHWHIIAFDGYQQWAKLKNRSEQGEPVRVLYSVKDPENLYASKSTGVKKELLMGEFLYPALSIGLLMPLFGWVAYANLKVLLGR